MLFRYVSTYFLQPAVTATSQPFKDVLLDTGFIGVHLLRHKALAKMCVPSCKSETMELSNYIVVAKGKQSPI